MSNQLNNDRYSIDRGVEFFLNGGTSSIKKKNFIFKLKRSITIFKKKFTINFEFFTEQIN